MLGLVAGCDTVEPGGPPRLVVEVFADAGQPLPTVRLWQTRPLGDAYPFDASTAATGADVTFRLGGAAVPYRALDEQPGLYGPAPGATASVPARVPVALEARWRDQQATAESAVPPRLRLDSLRLNVPEAPVDGIILDSLFIDPVKLDSLQFDSLKTGAAPGLVYLVEVTLFWAVDFAEAGPDSAYWIRAQLRPTLPERPVFDDFFFRPEQIFRERTATRLGGGRRAWTGVYAVPVASRTEPLPPHALRVALLRSHQDYARYASSRRDPERREPASNVTGALGIVAGLSLDSLTVRVE